MLLYLMVWKESLAGCICWEVPIGVTVLSRLVAVSGISGQGWTSRELVPCWSNWLINWISSWVGEKAAALWEVKLFSWDERLSCYSLSSLDQILRRKWMALLWLMVPAHGQSLQVLGGAHLLTSCLGCKRRKKERKHPGQPVSQLKDFPIDPGVFPDARQLPHGFGKHLAFKGLTLGSSDPQQSSYSPLCFHCFSSSPFGEWTMTWGLKTNILWETKMSPILSWRPIWPSPHSSELKHVCGLCCAPIRTNVG